jgi:polysaccharide export outer membrane protein
MIVTALVLGGCSKLGLSSAPYAPAPQVVASVPAYQLPAATPGYQAAPPQSYPTLTSGPTPRGFFAFNLGGPYARAPAQVPVYAAAAMPAAPAPSPPPVIAAASPAVIPAAAPTVTSGYTAQAAIERPYLINAGDRLRIAVYSQEGLTNSYLVDAAGNVTLPRVGTLRARGLTSNQLAYALSERLKQDYRREPKVAINVEAYRPLFIQGGVANPGQYPYVPNMTVGNAVAVAGGLVARADAGNVTLSRTFDGQTTRASVEPTYPLQPGDTVRVAERWF